MSEEQHQTEAKVDPVETDSPEPTTDANEPAAASSTSAAPSTQEQTPDLEPATESRNTTRINLNRPLLIRLSSGETVKAQMVNLSSDGLAFEYPAPAEPGAVFGIYFQLTNPSGMVTIQAEGVALHSHVKTASFIIGVEFTKISKEHIDFIEDYVEYKISAASQLTGF